MTSPAMFGTRPQRPRGVAYGRDANRDTLRASVLDVALQLGIGTSRAVENLMFDSVMEEDENATTPALTSASAATSDESWPLVPAWNIIPADVVLPVRKPTSIAATPTPDLQVGRTRSEDSHTPTYPLPHQPRKLRKARKDGYESDGGYLSDNSKKKKDKKGQKKGSESSLGPEYQSDGEHLSDLTRSGVDKKKKQKDKGSKMSGDLGADSSIKTSNVSTKKSRIPSDEGDVSDGGYLSEATGKKKRSFFSRRPRSPSTTRKVMPSDTPPVPTLPPTPIPTSGDATRSQSLSHSPDGSNPSGVTPIWASYRTVPPSLDERSVSSLSLQRRDRSPSPPSDDIRGAIRSQGVETSSEKLRTSPISHEIGGHSPVPHAPPWEPTPYIRRPHKPETHPQSLAQPHEYASASASAMLRQYGVRFPPSTRFDSSNGIFPTPPSSPAVMITSEGSPPRPKIIGPHALNASPSPGPPSPVPPVWRNASPMSAPLAPPPLFLSRSLRSTPSLGTLTPPHPRGVSPAFSDSSVMSSSDFIAPSPRPRFFEDLPPPSPPPTGPLPEVPSHGPYSHLVPQFRRGRQPPFPTRGVLPVQEVSRLIERTERRRLEGQVEIQPESLDDGDGHNALPQLTEKVVLVPPSPPHSDVQEDEYDWRDDESVRPDIAEFYFYGSPNPSGITAGGVAPRPSPHEPDDISTYKFPFVRSFSPENPPRGPMTPAVPSDFHNYYFGETGRDGGSEEGEGRSQFFDDDDGRNHAVRSHVARVDAFHGAEKTRLVPKLRPF